VYNSRQFFQEQNPFALEVSMNHRIALLAGAFALLTTPFGFGQARQASTKPDLQGIWTNATVTPLERPKEYADKPFLSREEAAEFEKRAVYDANGDRRDGGAEADVGRAYNEFWRDRGKVVSTLRTSLIVDPPDGRVPPLLPEAQKRNAGLADARRKLGGPFDGPEGRSLQERCLLTPQAGPPMLPANYNSNYQIVQTPDYIMIVVEMIHDARIIPLDGRPHLPRNVRSLMGDSRGHWEGNTLVVETTNFTDKTSFRGAGENLRITERFTRTDADTLLYQFTIEDETTWAKPWSGEIPMKKAPGPLFEYACNEGNYGMEGVLAGARAEEKRK
jgi:hypothetical protein